MTSTETRTNGKARTRRNTTAAAPTRSQTPEKFTYALAAYKLERRESGWYVARATPVFLGEKEQWTGPFELLENAALAAARRWMVEAADRHVKTIERYGFDRRHPLYGMKKTTRPKA